MLSHGSQRTSAVFRYGQFKTAGNVFRTMPADFLYMDNIECGYHPVHSLLEVI